MPVFRFEGVEIDAAPDTAIPICPSCKAELQRIWVKGKGVGGLSKQQILMCPHCRAFLGYGMERT